VWAVALAIVSLRTEALPDLLGWATVAALLMAAVTTVVASALSGPVVLVVSGTLFLALEAWLGAMAWTLMGRG
jgi:prepilin signal peptidase PulO-like enzyme (type II secretory pathway)